MHQQSFNMQQQKITWALWGRSTVPMYNSAENEKVFESDENWWFSAALLNKNFIFGTFVLRYRWSTAYGQYNSD